MLKNPVCPIILIYVGMVKESWEILYQVYAFNQPLC